MGKTKKTELLQQGTLELLVLRLLQSGELNGWDIMQRIRPRYQIKESGSAAGA